MFDFAVDHFFLNLLHTCKDAEVDPLFFKLKHKNKPITTTNGSIVDGAIFCPVYF